MGHDEDLFCPWREGLEQGRDLLWPSINEAALLRPAVRKPWVQYRTVQIFLRNSLKTSVKIDGEGIRGAFLRKCSCTFSNTSV